jgi:hypothetical protein
MAAEPAKPQAPPTEADLATLSPEDLLRLQALADKRNEALDNMTEAVRKANENRRGIVDRMR